MFYGVLIAIGLILLVFGPIPIGIFNQILGLILVVGGSWVYIMNRE